MPRMIQRASPTVLIILIGLLVGVSVTLSKLVAMSGVPSLLALFWQVAVASTSLLLVLLSGRTRPRIGRTYIVYYLGAGLLGVSVPGVIGYVVLEHISIGFYSALMTLAPMFTFIVAAFIEKRMLSLNRLVGISIGFVGISLATAQGLNGNLDASFWILLALAGPAVLAFGNVFRSRAYPVDANPTALAAGTLFLQVILIAPALLLSGQFRMDAAIDLAALFAIVSIGLISALSYALTFEVQRRTDGVGFSQVGYFATLFGITFGGVAFGEEISPVFAVSMVFLFLGLAVTNGHLKLPSKHRSAIASPTANHS